MTALDAPDPGESIRLLNPRRSAHATIRGYLYQTCLGVLRWLELKPNEILLCEGDEDLDRFLLGGEAVSEQVKAYTGSLGLSDRAVLESLGNFLRSYVALRQRGETRRFVFTTTAQEKKKRIGGLNYDLLEDWKKGTRTPEIFAAVRSLLEPREDDKNRAETAEAIAWLDAKTYGWKAFMNAVQWSFGAPDLSTVSYQIKNRLAARDDTRALPAETFRERLIAHVLRTSSLPRPEDRALTSKSLSVLIEEARTDLVNWLKTPTAERLRTLFDEFEKIRPFLHTNTDELPAKASPGKLLTAAYEVIPFDEAGRREELDFLTEWCNSDDRRSVLLLTGEGGSGKTRLMIEWCRHLRNEDWHAGFLKRDCKAEDLDPVLEGAIPRLIVIDYAETRLPVVEPFLRKVGQVEGEGPRLRLVLIARRKGDWWENLSRLGREVEDLLLRSPEPRTITPLVPQNIQEREKAFRAALDGFSVQLGCPIPEDLHVPDLSRDEFERVLYLHMAALAALQGERIETATDALKQTLRHERQFWYESVSHHGLGAGLTRLFQDNLEPAGAALVLVGGAKDLSNTSSLWGRVLEFELSPENLMILTLVFRDLYGAPPGDGHHMIQPLQPDLLGEELVAEALSRDEGLLGRVLDGAKPEESYSTLTVLTRLARRRPELEKWIGTALHGRLEALAEIALKVVVATGDPLGFKLAEEIESLESIEVVKRVQELCDGANYEGSFPLREVACIATERILALLRDSKSESNRGKQAKYAKLANNLAIRLSDLGRHEDALHAAQEAVATYRQLNILKPSSFKSSLATSLNNLGKVLTELGQHEEALNTIQEAVDLYQQLKSQRPNAFQSEFAASLNNLGNILSDLGRRENALGAIQEAIAIYRQLAIRRPDSFLSDIAMGLSNLGNSLSELGRYEDALGSTQEAVGIYRQLTAKRPDVFLPDLGMSLSNLGLRLSEVGRHEDALRATQEAINIRRQLVLRRPDAFLPDLANTLNNLGKIFSELRRHEDALRATQEAVDIRRQLALRRPDAFLPHFALSLNNLGNRLNVLGRREDAVQAVEEAVRILSPFFLRLPLAFATWMATIVQHYLRLVEVAGQNPSKELLNPIQEVLNRLAQEQPSKA